MSDLWVRSNLDFEYELAAGPKYRQSLPLQKLCERWQAILRLLPDCRDAELGPNQSGSLIPWGVTPTIEAMSASQSFPASSLVRSINDKRFSHRLEIEFGCGLAHAQVVESLGALESAVETSPHDWVLKHPFGVGGRERVVGRRGCFLDEARRWADTRFHDGWGLVFEPWAYERREFSFHYQIEQDGTVRYLGHCGLVSDESGAFRGNKVVSSDPPGEAFLTITSRAVARLAELGYWGPASIDAFTGHLGSTSVDRPIMEINARYSFGRLTLELMRWIPKGWCLYWWHPKARQRSMVERLACDHPGDTHRLRPGIYRLPVFADPGRASASYLVIAPEATTLDQLASDIPA